MTGDNNKLEIDTQKPNPKHRAMDLQLQPFSDLEEHDELSAHEIESFVSFVIQ